MESLEQAHNKPRLLRVVTRCATAQDFIITFGPFVEGESIFIGTRSPRPVGQRQPCMIVLKDGRVLLRGEAEVISVHDATTGPEGHPGMRIRFVQLDEGSRKVYADLIEGAKIIQSVDDKTPLLPMMPQMPDADPGASPLRKLVDAPRKRAARSATLLGMPLVPIPGADGGIGPEGIIPANPLGEIDDQALGDFIDGAIVDCAIYEETAQYNLALPLDDEEDDERGSASTAPLPAAAPPARATAPPPVMAKPLERAKTPPPVLGKTPVPMPPIRAKTPAPVLPGMPPRPQTPLPGLTSAKTPPPVLAAPEKPAPQRAAPEPPPAPPVETRPPAAEPPALAMSVPVNDLVDVVSGPIVAHEVLPVAPGTLPPVKLPGLTGSSPASGASAGASAAQTIPTPAAQTIPSPAPAAARPPATAAAYAATLEVPSLSATLPVPRAGAKFPVPMVAITLGAFLLGLGTGWLVFGDRGGARVTSAPIVSPPPAPAPSAGAPEETAARPETPPTAEPEAEAEAEPAPPEAEAPEAPRELSGPGLDLKSTPPGAVFFVNGKKVGKGPLLVPQKKGKVKIVAVKPGYKRWVRNMWHNAKLTTVHAKMARK